jgi:16S rRNA (uracil1498-N3)-methyltransferase
MPANERMDALVEKATELGVARIQPLVCERSVLRVAGERAARKAAHWHAVAVAACEQCGRNRVPDIAEPLALPAWLRGLEPEPAQKRCLLSTGDAPPWPSARPEARGIVVLSGPEGGFTSGEEAAACAAGFVAYSLGPRVLRADTAPLAALAWIALELA